MLLCFVQPIPGLLCIKKKLLPLTHKIWRRPWYVQSHLPNSSDVIVPEGVSFLGPCSFMQRKLGDYLALEVLRRC